MSAQVKKRFEELFTYFKGDRIAMERLKHLKDDVNVMRRALAEAERKEQEAIQLKDASRVRADEAERQMADVLAEAGRLKDKVNALECKVAQMCSAKTAHDDDSGSSPYGHNVECETTAAIRALRKASPDCPPPLCMARDMVSKDCRAFDRDSLASGWSRSSLWKLGASVAALALIYGDVLVVSSDTGRSRKVKNDGGGWRTAMFHWMRRNNIWEGSPEELRREFEIRGLGEVRLKKYHVHANQPNLHD